MEINGGSVLFCTVKELGRLKGSPYKLKKNTDHFKVGTPQ